MVELIRELGRLWDMTPLDPIANSSTRKVFVLIFEGRAGSSETIARLNRHPSIQAFPEILAPICQGGAECEWEAVEDIFRRLVDGLPIESFTESYSKLGAVADNSSIRGFKTRLNVPEDRWWYDRMDKVKNFYAVDPERFLHLAGKYNASLIRLHRRDILKQAISWLQAVDMNSRYQKWNVLPSEELPGPISVDPALVVLTMDWIAAAQLRHQRAYEGFAGRKLSITFEDLMAEGTGAFDQILEFLGAVQMPLAPHYRKATSDNLRDAVENYDALMDHLRETGRLAPS